MTPETAAKHAANNLIQAFKRLRLVDRSAKSDSPGPYRSRCAPSERWFQIDADCIDSIGKALLKLGDTVGTYPREKLLEAITDIVIAVRDTETPVERAHEGLAQGVLELLARIGCLGDWEVLHAVRGVQTYDQPFEIGRCSFSRMDEATFRLWGQRFATGKYDPPGDSPLTQSWVEQDSMLIGQAIAMAAVRASDSDHASTEGRRIIGESLDLLRYGQVTYGWPPEPVPEFGLAALSAHGYVQQQMICVRLDKPAISTNKSIGAGDGASILYCKDAPAWQGLECILKIAPDQRTELQRRIMLALAWVGQAALASSLPVRLVAFTTALETLLIEDSEALGKKSKLSTRVAAFPQMKQATGHIGSNDVVKLYGLRSGCLHGGETNVCIADTQLASMAVAQCFCGILDDPNLKSIRTLSELLTSIGGKSREEVVKQPPTKPLNTKVLGDAGEHYALSQFAFTGLPGTKMPDNWEGYDLAVETAAGLARVNVKVRSEGDEWKSGSWFSLDDRKQCDWIVFIFKPREGALRSWVMPIEVAKENASNPGPDGVDPWMHDISWSKLNQLPLSAFEDNWGMTHEGDVN